MDSAHYVSKDFYNHFESVRCEVWRLTLLARKSFPYLAITTDPLTSILLSLSHLKSCSGCPRGGVLPPVAESWTPLYRYLWSRGSKLLLFLATSWQWKAQPANLTDMVVMITRRFGNIYPQFSYYNTFHSKTAIHAHTDLLSTGSLLPAFNYNSPIFYNSKFHNIKEPIITFERLQVMMVFSIPAKSLITLGSLSSG